MAVGESQTQFVKQTLMPFAQEENHLALNKAKKLDMNVLIEMTSNKA
jgi:hypothetical protein